MSSLRKPGGGGGGLPPGLIDFPSISTTSNVQTVLGSYVPNFESVVQGNWRVTAKRDNDDFASFQWLGHVVVLDVGSIIVGGANNTAAAAPDFFGGSGSSLRIALDNTSGLRLLVTGNNLENWTWQAQLNYIEVLP